MTDTTVKENNIDINPEVEREELIAALEEERNKNKELQVKLMQLEDSLKNKEEDKNFYCERFVKATDEKDRIKNVIGAIGTLLQSINQD